MKTLNTLVTLTLIASIWTGNASAGFEGTENTFYGVNAGTNTTGDIGDDGDTFIGVSTGYNNTSGIHNTFLGYHSGFFNLTGSYNSFVGSLAGNQNSTGSYNTFLGYGAGSIVSTALYNTFLGAGAGYASSGGSNTFVGHYAGFSSSGGYNTFVGDNAGVSTTSGNSNTILGTDAGYLNTTGARNVFLGYQAGYNETRSDRLYIANSSTTNPLIFGNFAVGKVKINGNLDVTGSLTKGSGTFVQPHPADPSKEVAYAFFEGPEHAIFLRGKAKLVKGRATITTPEYFRVVAGKDEDITIQFTPRSIDTFGVAAVQVTKDSIEVRELKGGKNSYEFDYFITAKRGGFESYQPIQANTHFTATEKTAEDFEQIYAKTDDLTINTMRQLLIANGILTKDGKLNQTTATKLGWQVRPVQVATTEP